METSKEKKARIKAEKLALATESVVTVETVATESVDAGTQLETENVAQADPVAVVVIPAKSIAELNAVIDGLDETDKAMLNTVAGIAANVLAGTKGQYVTLDGKGVTSDRTLAKLNINKKPIPQYTPTRLVTVGGITVTGAHVDEVLQLRGRYTNGWGIAVIARLKAATASRGRELTQGERDAEINQIGTPAAWLIRYNKDLTPASQSARHLAVIAEFMSK